MSRHFLVPIDGSELFTHALQHNVGLALQRGTRATGFDVGRPRAQGCQLTRTHLCPREGHLHSMHDVDTTIVEAAHGFSFNGWTCRVTT